MNKKILYPILCCLALIIVFFLFAFRYRGGTSVIERSGDKRDTAMDIAALASAKPMPVVDLNDGDTYDMVAEVVKKKIGNNQIRMLGYNGSIPGPLIRAPKGAEITLRFTNQIDVPTTIHSHGVRLANAFDGVPDVTQPEIKPGQSFTYKIKLPDEGVYWYHPHIREDYAQELGLYGNYVVIPEDPNYWSPVDRTEYLFLDDIYIQKGQTPFDPNIATHALMGRFGNVMLVNGETEYRLNVTRGDVDRFFFTNSANTRVFNLRIPGAKMKLVGGDNGKYERETMTDSVLLGPSERAAVDVFFPETKEYQLLHVTPEKTYPLGVIAAKDGKKVTFYEKEFQILRKNNDTIASIDPFRDYFTKAPDKSITLSIQMKSMMGSGGNMHNMHGSTSLTTGGGNAMPNSMMQMGDVKKIEWEDDMGMMNANSTKDTLVWQIKDDATGKTNMDIDWKFKVGEKVKIKIFNDPKSTHPMQHPIHFHGQRFLVLSTNGVKNTNLVWKDTTLIQTGDTVEVLVYMSNPGVWMAHCHISEHLEAGMMMGFGVQS